MKLFSLGVLATVTGLAVGFCLLVLGGRNLIQLIFGLVYKRIMTEHYWTNLFETYNLAKMIGLGRLVETELRSAHGQPPARPFGLRDVVSPWKELYFNPVYLHRLPLLDYTKVGTEVVIGRSALPFKTQDSDFKRGMAYGTALSAKTKQALALGATMAGTAANTGNGPFCPRSLNRCGKIDCPVFPRQLGQGSGNPASGECHRNSAGSRIMGAGAGGDTSHPVGPNETATFIRRQPGRRQDSSRFLEVETDQELRELVAELRERRGEFRSELNWAPPNG